MCKFLNNIIYKLPVKYVWHSFPLTHKPSGARAYPFATSQTHFASEQTLRNPKLQPNAGFIIPF